MPILTFQVRPTRQLMPTVATFSTLVFSVVTDFQGAAPILIYFSFARSNL